MQDMLPIDLFDTRVSEPNPGNSLAPSQRQWLSGPRFIGEWPNGHGCGRGNTGSGSEVVSGEEAVGSIGSARYE
jgi:hypothetical protein